MTDDEMIESVRFAVKAKGCLCRVEITLDRPDPDEPLMVHAQAIHDNWCPLALSRNRVNN